MQSCAHASMPICLLALIFTVPSFSQQSNDSALIMGADWLRSKLNGYYAERYRSGEIYKEYEIKMDFDYKTQSFIYELDRKGTSMGDHFKYIIPLTAIDASKIALDKNQCCKNDPLYYETNEAEIIIHSVNRAPLFRLCLIDKSGKEFELEHKRNEVRIFIPTGAALKTENLPEKCQKVIEMMIRLVQKE